MPKVRIRALAAGLVTTLIISIGLGALIRMSGAAGFLALSLPNFTAVVLGGFVAGWIARRTGAIHGAIVAGLYLFISGVFNLADEIGVVGQGSTAMLPPMNMAGLLVSDIVLLVGAALAGGLGDNLSRGRPRSDRPADDTPV